MQIVKVHPGCKTGQVQRSVENTLQEKSVQNKLTKFPDY